MRHQDALVRAAKVFPVVSPQNAAAGIGGREGDKLAVQRRERGPNTGKHLGVRVRAIGHPECDLVEDGAADRIPAGAPEARGRDLDHGPVVQLDDLLGLPQHHALQHRVAVDEPPDVAVHRPGLPAVCSDHHDRRHLAGRELGSVIREARLEDRDERSHLRLAAPPADCEPELLPGPLRLPLGQAVEDVTVDARQAVEAAKERPPCRPGRSAEVSGEEVRVVDRLDDVHRLGLRLGGRGGHAVGAPKQGPSLLWATLPPPEGEMAACGPHVGASGARRGLMG